MCGRVTVRTSTAELQREFDLTVAALELRPRFNLCPTQPMPVVANTGLRELELYRWGLIPSWAKDAAIGNKLINARADTLAEKPSYRNAFKKRRCLVLVDGFYEWRADEGGKTPFHIRRTDGRPFAIAGLWEEWTSPAGEKLRSCALITTEPNPLMARIHDRMPVILPGDARERWLRPGDASPDELSSLLVPYASEELEAIEVSRLVNSPKNDRPECLIPTPPASGQVQRVLL